MEIFQEYDVFRMPHSRMMQLVNSCNKNLNITDFANNDALFGLLDNLQTIFNEFKSHEDIENKHIMTKLKSKLNAMAIYNSAVCNCHTNDEFTPLMELVETGYLFMNKAIATSERISFGVRLRRALNKFTRTFVPHMKEEEEVFQPLLCKYFSQEELAEMKNVVIKLHLQKRRKAGGPAESSGQPLPRQLTVNHEETLDRQFFNHLPSEIILKIFSYMDHRDKIRAAEVCRKWNALVYDRSNWQELSFSDWKRSKNISGQQSYYYKDFEYIDESDEEEFDNLADVKYPDLKTLQFWIKYLLPRVGAHLVKLDLSNCKSLNNNLTRRILQLCPNLVELNLSHTSIGDNSFRGVRLDKLKNLNCEGCQKLSDNAFKFLLLTSIFAISREMAAKTTDRCVNTKQNSVCPMSRSRLEETAEETNEPSETTVHKVCEEKTTEAVSSCSDCSASKNIEDLHLLLPANDQLISKDRDQISSSDISNSLVSINLSGCWSITDYGLSYIASKYDLSNLQYVNLSGCMNLTAFGMELFLELSKELNGENLYYCDNIVDGPMRNEANGCDNLECLSKYCCKPKSDQ